MLHGKNNLGPPAQGLVAAPYVVWDQEPVSTTADQALAAQGGLAGVATATDDATEFLQALLKAEPRFVPDIEREARLAGLLGPAQPISQYKPFRTAREKLGIPINR